MPPRRAPHHYTRIPSAYQVAVSLNTRARMDVMREMRAAGMKNVEIAQALGLTQGRVSSLFKKYGG